MGHRSLGVEVGMAPRGESDSSRSGKEQSFQIKGNNIQKNQVLNTGPGQFLADLVCTVQASS